MTNSSAPSAPFIALGSRLRPSPFYEATRRWGAKSFSIYNHMLMPSVYESAEADYEHLVNGVTLWDVAGERQVEISGDDAFAFTQYLTPRDLSPCLPGRCRYVLLTNQYGGVLNDPVLLRLEENRFWLSIADSDIFMWCQGIAMQGNFNVEIRRPDVSPLQLQGPQATDVGAALFGDWVRDMKYFHLKQFEWEGVPLVLSRTGWSGELGFEIYLCDGSRGDWLWERIMEAGKPFNIRPASPSTIRRIEGGLLSYGADADTNDTPYHLGLGRLVKTECDFNFIGKDALQHAASQPLQRRLTGVMMDGDPIASSLRWWDVFCQEQHVGKVRSAVYSPRLKKNIGMAMLNCPYDIAGTTLQILDEHGISRAAETCELPFIQSKK
ncbi:MAG: glycine cleavage T C-terminal barrel domain-containing protein [Gammaproteobacteria bacterium WSBS_2016_MAG_OTU1]